MSGGVAHDLVDKTYSERFLRDLGIMVPLPSPTFSPANHP